MSGRISVFERYLGKIDRTGLISPEGRTAFLAMSAQRVAYRANQDIVREGERTQRSCLVESGFVSRYRTLRSGERQIVSFHIAADMIDLSSVLVVVADHGIRTHGPVSVATVAHHEVLAIAAQFPDVARALWFDTLVDAAIFREWTLNVGRRNSRQRTAHLLLELATRCKAVGLLIDNSFELPMNQAELADALAITSVHLNRTLQWLRGERLIRTHARMIEIENWPAMISLADFDPTYLHPEGPRRFDGSRSEHLESA